MRLSIATLLLLAMPLSAMAADLAYIDSPAGRSVNDPARADGFSSPAAASMTGASNTQSQISQMQMQLLAQSMANARATQAQPPGTGDMSAMGPGAPMTAGLGGMPGQAPPGMGGPSPMQQIGAGMAQDAGNLMDAGIQRSINGGNGNVIVVPQPPYSTQPQDYSQGGGNW